MGAERQKVNYLEATFLALNGSFTAFGIPKTVAELPHSKVFVSFLNPLGAGFGDLFGAAA